ncbi:putative aldo-keto reductase protein [Eutypa lata UCREL1]|uniref:Putative aldo-keto reductase protein n=1 Tax=Eutypa lata (strain UCR-EL1) TaxID=1287681 RepID=M7T444_EUTLA|nr:putative aldo-keto reductase protein [Eutypa lata UCREL1]
MHSFPIGTNGRQLPAIGLGTFQPEAAPPDVVKQAVVDALNEGYRLIDTAFMYGNVVERAVGDAIREWGGPREDIWVTSKLGNSHHRPRDVGPAIDMSLRNLGLEYNPVAYKTLADDDLENRGSALHPDGRPVIDVDLTLGYASTWAAMEQAVAEGKVREIGVSNFSILKLRKLLEAAKIVPAVNQTEMHPRLTSTYHTNKIRTLGTKHNVSPAVILLAWALKRGTSVVPKSYSKSHIKENLAALDVSLSLSTQAMEQIADAAQRDGKEMVRFMDTRGYFGFDIFSEGVEERPCQEIEIEVEDGRGRGRGRGDEGVRVK